MMYGAQIFVGYVADTYLVHNTIHDTKYSGICAGWGTRSNHSIQLLTTHSDKLHVARLFKAENCWVLPRQARAGARKQC